MMFRNGLGTLSVPIYFFWNNSAYLLVCDYYSKFPFVRKLNNIQSNTTIAHLKSIFEEQGIPSKVVTGNDTQFTSAGSTGLPTQPRAHTTLRQMGLSNEMYKRSRTLCKSAGNQVQIPTLLCCVCGRHLLITISHHLQSF